MLAGDLWTAAKRVPELKVCQQRLGRGIVLGLELQALGMEPREVRQDAGLQRHGKNSGCNLVFAGDGS